MYPLRPDHANERAVTHREIGGARRVEGVSMPFPLWLVAVALATLTTSALASRCDEYKGAQPTPTPIEQASLDQARELEKANPRRAIALYKESATRMSNGHAAYRLAYLYHKGMPGVPRDLAESLHWGEVARKLGVRYWFCS